VNGELLFPDVDFDIQCKRVRALVRTNTQGGDNSSSSSNAHDPSCVAFICDRSSTTLLAGDPSSSGDVKEAYSSLLRKMQRQLAVQSGERTA